MFTVFCPRHQVRVLILPSMIDHIDNSRDGIDVHYHCSCGYPGVWRTGRSSAA